MPTAKGLSREVLEKALRRGSAFQAMQRDAAIIKSMLELGDQRLLALDGPCGGMLPDLSPEEWGKVYRACVRIVKRAGMQYSRPHQRKDKRLRPTTFTKQRIT